jgi:hypothetical protein
VNWLAEIGGILIALGGLLIAALSLYIIYRERTSFYRDIIYKERLEHYKDIITLSFSIQTIISRISSANKEEKTHLINHIKEHLNELGTLIVQGSIITSKDGNVFRILSRYRQLLDEYTRNKRKYDEILVSGYDMLIKLTQEIRLNLGIEKLDKEIEEILKRYI